MIFILNIYKKDSRTKSGRRIHGSYEYDRKDLVQMEREVKELELHHYRENDGFTFEVIETKQKI